MTFKDKLEAFQIEIKEYYQGHTVIQTIRKIVFWVQENTRYKDESAAHDRWVEDFDEVLAKAKDGKFEDDCDGYACLIFFFCEMLGIKTWLLRCELKRDTDKAHMMGVYIDPDGTWHVIASTGSVIESFAVISLDDLDKLGWRATHIFRRDELRRVS